MNCRLQVCPVISYNTTQYTGADVISVLYGQRINIIENNKTNWMSYVWIICYRKTLNATVFFQKSKRFRCRWITELFLFLSKIKIHYRSIARKERTYQIRHRVHSGRMKNEKGSSCFSHCPPANGRSPRSRSRTTPPSSRRTRRYRYYRIHSVFERFPNSIK